MENGTGVQLRLRRISRQAMPNMPSMAEDGSGTASASRDAGKRSVLGSIKIRATPLFTKSNHSNTFLKIFLLAQ